MRIATQGVPRFQHDGLTVESGWGEFDLGGAPPEAAKAFVDHVGRFIKIHPDDVHMLAEFGLALQDGRIVDATPAPPPAPATEPTADPAITPDPAPARAPEPPSEPRGRRQR